MNRPHNNGTAPPPSVRCAVYTRKSTEEGLEQEFNSLDAQRESAEAFVASQRSEGWTVLATRYDDGGFTGGNMERPALHRLLADIEAGQVDCVVVYKVDRLSRSLLDFARMMQVFEKHRVSFVSVTQQFNTATSMGRLVLNVLLSFAQFEREIIAERTRDKIAATRRKGKWAGGQPVLGYDVDPRGLRLQVNETEAEQVRAIFGLYLEHGSLLPVVQELARRGWTGKCWQTKGGRQRGGQPFTRTSLYRLLTNVLYAGKVRYKDEVHAGEHPALLDSSVFQRVQETLRAHGRGGPAVPGRGAALLQGILRCVPCGCAMTPTHTAKGPKRYRYYTCCSAQKRGARTCPSGSVPAGPLEELVVSRLRSVGRDPALRAEIVAQARRQAVERVSELEVERRVLEKDLARWHGEVRQLTGQLHVGEDNGPLIARLADVQEKVGQAEDRARQFREQLQVAQRQRINEAEAARALALFDPVWLVLAPREQARVVQLLVERVDYDAARGKVALTFRPAGIKALTEELAEQTAKEQTA
jgi:site-specific DNA recombinase